MQIRMPFDMSGLPEVKRQGKLSSVFSFKV